MLASFCAGILIPRNSARKGSIPAERHIRITSSHTPPRKQSTKDVIKSRAILSWGPDSLESSNLIWMHKSRGWSIDCLTQSQTIVIRPALWCLLNSRMVHNPTGGISRLGISSSASNLRQICCRKVSLGGLGQGHAQSHWRQGRPLSAQVLALKIPTLRAKTPPTRLLSEARVRGSTAAHTHPGCHWLAGLNLVQQKRNYNRSLDFTHSESRVNSEMLITDLHVTASFCTSSSIVPGPW